MRNKQRTQSSHQSLAELATGQHGVVSMRQLEQLGYSRATVSRATAAGRLHRLDRGVYAVGHRHLTWEARCLGAVLASAPAVASHTTAAWLWGLLRGRPGTFHLTAASRRHAKPGCRMHFAKLSAEDRGEADDIPVTAVARTKLDLAAMLSPTRLERVLERSEELRLFDLRAIDDLLTRTVGHPGHGRLRRALALYREDPVFVRSRLERRFLDLVRKGGLPTPSMNLNVDGYELDAYWEPERFAVELDVYETHGSHAAFERDRLRQEDLKLREVEMIRVTGPRLDREPQAVLARVAAHLELRRRQLPRREAATR
jgi:very-short-patch-repair endonuclease